MGDSPDPWTIIMGVIAVFAVIEVGIPLAEARSNAALPLLGECPSILFSSSSTFDPVHILGCGTGILIIATVPGAIGIGWLIFRG